ncbi:unnamed protein product [Candidula unifasciata]|uniref:Transmembrane protein 26 n=1 Tax=Candidula unifasciata TaxID=100452 RepID=A0A8S3YYV9_9EUPU|nr:unnamed protein product [Candidula unifasciata]
MVINWFSISKAVAVRCLLTFHAIMCFWRVVLDLRDSNYWLLLCGLLPLVCETCYTLIRRQGVEFPRFTPCFLCYLMAVLPGIWLLELHKTDQYIWSKNNNTLQAEEQNKSSEFFIFHEMLDSKTWLIVIEEMLTYVMFASRWVLPRGRVRREELAELLFAFIEIAADIMEFFSLIGEDVIRKDKTLSFWVLGIWSLSILQFTMTVTVIHQPKKEKKVTVVVIESDTDKQRERVRHECFAIFLTMAMQDLPFAIMRLYTIIKFSYINYSLIFFTSKNLIIIMLLLYKVIAVCKNQYRQHAEDHAGDTVKRKTAKTDGAEKGFNNLQNIFATSKPGGVGDQKIEDRQNEEHTESNHSNESVDYVLEEKIP